MRGIFSVSFWKDAGERGVRTAAQALLALWATNVSGLLEVDWGQALSVSGFAAATSILMSIVATNRGDSHSASIRKSE